MIVIHQQLVPFRPTHFQAHLVLETNLPFRLILYWITLYSLPPFGYATMGSAWAGLDHASTDFGYQTALRHVTNGCIQDQVILVRSRKIRGGSVRSVFRERKRCSEVV